jgi:hypothetical protein
LGLVLISHDHGHNTVLPLLGLNVHATVQLVGGYGLGVNNVPLGVPTTMVKGVTQVLPDG